MTFRKRTLAIEFDRITGKFLITCPFQMNELVKGLPSRKFNKRTKKWEAPAIIRNATAIRQLSRQPNVLIDEKAKEAVREIEAKKEKLKPKSVGFPKDFDFKTHPFIHQMRGLEFGYGLDNLALFMCPGTGKSKISIDLSGVYWKEDTIDAHLVVCPISIRDNWVDQYNIHASVDYIIEVVDTTSQSKIKRLERFITEPSKKLKVLIVGCESLSQWNESKNTPTGRAYSICQRFLLTTRPMVSVDESHMIKNHDKNRSRTCVALSKLAKKKVIMTGTPISKGILDFFMQFEFLDPDVLGFGDYYSFRNRYAVVGGYENKEVIGFQNVDELMGIIKPWVYQVTKEEALPDLPSKIYQRRVVKMSKKQIESYREMHKKKKLEIPKLNPDGSNIEIVAQNILSMTTSLQQIVGGFITYSGESYDGKKERKMSEIVSWRHNPKIQEVLDVLEENCGDQCIIWAVYRKEIQDLVEAINWKFGEGAAVDYHGGYDREERDVQITKFKTGEARYIVANQVTGGIGNTWTEASLMIYYSNSRSFVDRIQSEDRNHRIGQKASRCVYIDILADNTVDLDMEDSRFYKKDLADYVKSELSGGQGYIPREP